MKHLEFKNKYKKLLVCGKKKSTIRKKCYVKEGEEVFVHCGGKIIGKAKIIKVEEKNLDKIDDAIAKEEGFNNKEELIKEIRNIYGNVEKVYLIKFEFEPFEKPILPEEMYYGSEDLIEIAKKSLKNLELDEKEKYILNLFLECGSLKKTAIKLGGVWERKKVRDLLRKCFKMLKEKNLI